MRSESCPSHRPYLHSPTYTGRFGRTADAGEDWPVVPDRDRVSRLLVRAAWAARHLSQGGVDGRLDFLHNQFVTTMITV